MAKKVVIVEDDDDLALMLQMLLEEEGYQVATLHQPDEQQVLAQKPDLILVDLWFGEEKAGAHFVKQVKPKTNGQISIMMMSSDSDLVSIAHEVKADSYLMKPFDIEYFLQKVKTLT